MGRSVVTVASLSDVHWFRLTAWVYERRMAVKALAALKNIVFVVVFVLKE